MKVFLPLLRLLSPHKPAMFLAVLLALCTVVSNVGLLAVSALLLSCAALHPPVLDLMTLIVGVRFFGISRAVFRYLERYVSHDTTFKILKELRVWLYARLEPFAPAGLRHFKSADLLNTLVGQVEVLQNFYLRVLAPPVTALLVLLATFGFLACFDLRLALAYLAFYLLAGLGAPLLVQMVSRGVGQRLVEVKGRLNAHLVDCLQGMLELKVFNRQDHYLKEARALGQELVKWQGKGACLAGLSHALTGLMSHLALWTLLVLAIPLVEGGRLPGTHLAMLALAAFSSFEAVPLLPLLGKHWEESRTAAQNLWEISRIQPAVKEVSRLEGPVQPRDYSLKIKDLSFRYEKDGPWVLQDLNLELPAGGKLAIVGPNGAGKSTLVNLLLRFWDYEQGEILLGGRELKEFSPSELRKLMSVVSQKPHLFNATIRENLLLAKPGASQAEIYQAAQRAQLHDFITSLPQGYDTYVGEKGLKLSGGQRQRLAIARAILKDAPILILDEATTGLDALTERQIMEELLEMMEGKTTLVITHRLVGLAKMDEILVLKEGKVVERGREEELLARKTFYRRMWELQRQVLAS